MAADDKESDEGRPSRSLERDRGKLRRRRHSASPSPPKQRRERSRPPGAEEKLRHKTSAGKYEASTEGHELRNRNAEGVLEEASGKEASRKSGVEARAKAGATRSSKGDRKVEVHSSGDSSEDAYSDSDSNRGRRKSRSKNDKSRKSKMKHRRHIRTESEQDKSQTEGTFGESSEAGEGKCRRAETRKWLKRNAKAERERKEERRRKKGKNRKFKEKEREQEKRMQQKEKAEEAAEGRKTQSSGCDASEDAYSDSDSDRGREKSRSENDKSRKSKRRHRRHVRAEPEHDKSQTEGTFGESSEDSDGKSRRAEIRKLLKRKEKAEREGKDDQRRKRAEVDLDKLKLKEEDREQEKRMKNKEKVEEPAKSTRTRSRGKYGIITELDMRTLRREFSVWLAEVKKVNVETLTTREEQDMFGQYMQDYNKATFPSEKYYDLDMYHRRKVTEQRSKDMEDMVKKQSERTELKDEEQRRQEHIAERALTGETGMGKAVRDEAVSREDMQYDCSLGTTEVCKEEKDDDVGDRPEGDNMYGESSNGDPILDPKHKIFLSHSGAQKEFVDFLCKALEDRCHYPFFDRRDESLPKGEGFAELIVEAAEQCEMLIVVVSNEYFLSKWPMIELSAFVKAHKLHPGSKMGPKILPLFYRLSVSDLDNAELQKKWFDEWTTLADADPMDRIVLSDWRAAFHALRAFNGLPYDMNLKEAVAYVDKIVSHVCHSIAPDIKWDDSHVQGKSNIFKVTNEWMKRVQPSLRYQVKVLGMYGVGGIGKTTTCKILCNELLSQYEGRVCHIEFPSVPSFESKELYQKVVRDLTSKSIEVIQSLEKGECKDILRKTLFKRRTFLAIDNVSDSYQSIQEARDLLGVGYHKDSLVFVIARSRSVLERLGIGKDAYFEMPDLGMVDAMNLFLHHAIGGKQFFGIQENLDIMTCIKRCYFSKGNGRDCHFHPLALQALGLQLGFCGQSPWEWVKKLSELHFLNEYSSENLVFDILRGSFDMLSREDQTLFVDVGFFCIVNHRGVSSSMQWLCAAHKQDEGALLLRVDRLKRKGLVQDVHSNGTISMHDLYLEFAKLEVSGSFYKSLNLSNPIWKYVANGDFYNYESKGWHKSIRLCVGHSFRDLEAHGVLAQIEGMEGVKWNCFSHLEVLILSGVDFGLRSLNLEGVNQLKILQLYNLCAILGVEGLGKLKHLTIFSWTSQSYTFAVPKGGRIVGQLPSSLKHLTIGSGQVALESNLFAQCNNLFKLNLDRVEVHSLDLSNCISLESVVLRNIGKLQTLLISNGCLPSCLQDLDVSACCNLVDISGIGHLIDLKKLRIWLCSRLEVPSLLALTKLQNLDLNHQQFLARSTKDCFPYHLQVLCLLDCHIGERLNLFGFNELKTLNLDGVMGLTSLEDLGDLPTLRWLDLSHCKNILRLPNLSSSRNLKELKLNGCLALELHEEDIQMLSELPMLQPVSFTRKYKAPVSSIKGAFVISINFSELPIIKTKSVTMESKVRRSRLDFARRKELFCLCRSSNDTWSEWTMNDWEEQDLGAPPLKIRQ